MPILIMKQLTNYKRAKEALINHFAKKQGFSEWYESGNILCFGDYYFSIEDIVLDIENNCKAGNILQWQDEQVGAKNTINYNSYCMGLTFEMVEQMRKESEFRASKRVQDSLEYLKNCIEDEKK